MGGIVHSQDRGKSAILIPQLLNVPCVMLLCPAIRDAKAITRYAWEQEFKKSQDQHGGKAGSQPYHCARSMILTEA